MKRLLGLLLVMGMVGCGDPVAELEKLGAEIKRNNNGEVVDVDLDYKAINSITDAGLVHLKEMTSLEMLWLHGTQITDAGIAELRTALPDCKVTQKAF